MSLPPTDDETLILRYFNGELNEATRLWVERRTETDSAFRALFELYRISSNSSLDTPSKKQDNMTAIKFTPPGHQKPKPRNKVLLLLIALLIIVLIILLLL